MNTPTNLAFNNKLYYKSYNILKKLGFKTSHIGTKLIIKAILILLNDNYDTDFVSFEYIYSIISSSTSISPIRIRCSIKYAIDNRNFEKSKKNFEEIFGYEYDEYVFTNKNIIEEISNIIQLESI